MGVARGTSKELSGAKGMVMNMHGRVFGVAGLINPAMIDERQSLV